MISTYCNRGDQGLVALLVVRADLKSALLDAWPFIAALGLLP